jgi:hypothetical protein
LLTFSNGVDITPTGVRQKGSLRPELATEFQRMTELIAKTAEQIASPMCHIGSFDTEFARSSEQIERTSSEIARPTCQFGSRSSQNSTMPKQFARSSSQIQSPKRRINAFISEAQAFSTKRL